MRCQRSWRTSVAAVSLYEAHFNLCRVHESLRITSPMARGSPITSRRSASWSMATLAERMEQQAA
jgi:hypothetical protein